MDWRPESRSRSRPPMNGMSDSHNQFKFPSSPPKRESGIPIPSSSGHRSPQAGLPAVYESTGEQEDTTVAEVIEASLKRFGILEALWRKARELAVFEQHNIARGIDEGDDV